MSQSIAAVATPEGTLEDAPPRMLVVHALWSDGAIEVTLVDPNEAFVSCPISNLVIGGSKTMGGPSPAT